MRSSCKAHYLLLLWSYSKHFLPYEGPLYKHFCIRNEVQVHVEGRQKNEAFRATYQPRSLDEAKGVTYVIVSLARDNRLCVVFVRISFFTFLFFFSPPFLDFIKLPKLNLIFRGPDTI